MVPRVWSLMRFLIKGSVAGGAIYLVYDQDLLGPSDKSQAALQKAEEVVPPAVYQFSQYVCEQTGLKIPQLPSCLLFTLGSLFIHTQLYQQKRLILPDFLPASWTKRATASSINPPRPGPCASQSLQTCGKLW
uniref:MICOS complex subunit MIC13 n=1 Tax=Sus scrofa TaxID=9823 RepID=A0A4X1VLD5_PIG